MLFWPFPPFIYLSPPSGNGPEKLPRAFRLRNIFATGSKPCPPPPGMSEFPSFDIPTSPIIGGKKLFNDDGPGYMDPDWEPPKPTSKLPTGWFVDENSFYTLHLPAVQPTRAHVREADCEAFPHPLTLYRFALDRQCFERFKMNAYWVGLGFHHFMGKHVPGFWDVQNYKNVSDHKVIRLIFDGQCEIIFYGTHNGCPTTDDGATWVVIDGDGKRYVLLYNSPSADRDICYPEHLDLEHPAFELPSRATARAIIRTYAMIAAIPPDAIEQLTFSEPVKQLEHQPDAS